MQGAYEEAAVYYAESLHRLHGVGNRSDVPRLLHNRAYIALQDGDRATAARLFSECLNLFQVQGNERGIIEALAGIAAVVAATQPERAAEL